MRAQTLSCFGRPNSSPLRDCLTARLSGQALIPIGSLVLWERGEGSLAIQAKRFALAISLATMEGHCGAIAFSRTDNWALGGSEGAVTFKAVGEAAGRRYRDNGR